MRGAFWPDLPEGRPACHRIRLIHHKVHEPDPSTRMPSSSHAVAKAVQPHLPHGGREGTHRNLSRPSRRRLPQPSPRSPSRRHRPQRRNRRHLLLRAMPSLHEASQALVVPVLQGCPAQQQQAGSDSGSSKRHSRIQLLHRPSLGVGRLQRASLIPRHWPYEPQPCEEHGRNGRTSQAARPSESSV